MARAERLRAFPRNRLIAHELLRGRTTELSLLQHLGPPTGETDPREEPRFFWDLAWDCGLHTSLAFDQLTEVVSLHLDEPELDHARRHLGIELTELWLWQLAEPERFAASVPHPPERSWSLWRVEADGTRSAIASHIVERDARCWARGLAVVAAEDGDAATFEVAPLPAPPAGAGARRRDLRA